MRLYALRHFTQTFHPVYLNFILLLCLLRIILSAFVNSSQSVSFYIMIQLRATSAHGSGKLSDLNVGLEIYCAYIVPGLSMTKGGA
jgi:hypothetical protein